MSNYYYYLIASLPMLHFGMKPSIAWNDFLTVCQEQLIATDFEIIQKIISSQELPPHSTKSVLKAWFEFNHQLRNELAWSRALEAKKDPLNHTRGPREAQPAIVEMISQAFKSRDPLTAEKILDRFRWQYLDELTEGHYFDLEFLITFALKLKILERYQLIESPKGKEIFKEYTHIKVPL